MNVIVVNNKILNAFLVAVDIDESSYEHGSRAMRVFSYSYVVIYWYAPNNHEQIFWVDPYSRTHKPPSAG